MTHYSNDLRHYDPAVCVTFRKTKEAFGGLSNMAGGFPVCVNGISIRSSEALYQACRFPHRPEVQQLILDQKSPMTAKMKSKPYRMDSRQDWDQVRTTIMRWALRVKLYCNKKFYDLLISTGNLPIVENSSKDFFWGAIPKPDGMLVGRNILGRLLMELREEIRDKKISFPTLLSSPKIPDFLLLGTAIGELECSWHKGIDAKNNNLSPIPEIADCFRPLEEFNFAERSESLECRTVEKFCNVPDVDTHRETEDTSSSSGLNSAITKNNDGCEYSQMLFQLQHLAAREQADAIIATATNSSEFSLFDFRILLEQWSKESNSPNQKIATRVLKRHRTLMDKLVQPPLF